MTAAIVLAAGLSRRMGQPKLLLPVEGVPVIRRTVQRLLDAGIETVLVVVGPGPDAALIASALDGLPVTLVTNPAPGRGQASSIVAGLGALDAQAEAALIALGDQPTVSPSVIRALVAARDRSGLPIAVPVYRDGRGNPVLFARATFAELLALAGDRGARVVVERDPSRVVVVAVDAPMPPDIDTPDDYERLQASDNPV
jgi:molybdenum cofactor cytidylyltransferase